MQNIKIPLSIKIYSFFIFVLTTFNIIFLDFVYAFHNFWKYFWLFFWIAFLSLLYSISLFSYIKNPSKWNWVFQIALLSFSLLSNIISAIIAFNDFWALSLIWSIPFIIIIWLLINRFRKINKSLKNPEVIIYSSKSQIKWILITLWVFILWLIIFYFTYFNNSYQFKQIPDSYFDETELYKDVKSSENWYEALKEFQLWKNYTVDIKKWQYIPWKKLSNVTYWYDNHQLYYAYKWQKFYNDTQSFYNYSHSGTLDIDTSKKRIEMIDNLRLWLKPITESEILTREHLPFYLSFQEFTSKLRETIHIVIYNLERWEEKVAIDYTIQDFKIWKNLTNWYSGYVENIIWLMILSNTNKSLNYILDNYEFTKTTLEYLRNEIKSTESIEWAFQNKMIYEYNTLLNEIESFERKTYFSNRLPGSIPQHWNSFIENFIFADKNLNLNSLIFFSDNYVLEMHKNIYYYTTHKWDYEEKFCDWTTLKNFDSVIKVLLKKNGYLTIQWAVKCAHQDNIKAYLQDELNLLEQEKLLLEKIETKIEEAEKNENDISKKSLDLLLQNK